MKSFLSGDLEQSVKHFSHAIAQDSLLYENYYFRGLTRAYLSDTVNCLADFFKAIHLKKQHPHVSADSMVVDWVTSRPVRGKFQCSRSLDQQSEPFFQTWLAAWLILGDDTHEACKNLGQAEFEGLRQIKAYRQTYCR